MAEYLNVLVTLGAAIVAYRAYISTTNDNRSKHVHELFKEYMRARLEIDKDKEEFIGFKMYALEEAYAWIKKIKRTADGNKWLMTRRSYEESRIFCKAWLATIEAHLNFEPDEILNSINLYENCYSPGFVAFARQAISKGRES